MRAKYADHWFQSLTFTQNNTSLLASGREVKSQANITIGAPRRMRVDYVTAGAGTGVLYVNGRTYEFVSGKQQRTYAGTNPVLLLLADVYASPIDSVLADLKGEDFPLSPVRDETIDGHRYFIVGGMAGDTTHNQFWVDAERLVVTRFIQRLKVQSGGTTREAVSDVRATKFLILEGLPIPAEVTRYRDGRLVLREEWVDVKVNPAIDPATFDAGKWRQ